MMASSARITSIEYLCFRRVKGTEEKRLKILTLSTGGDTKSNLLNGKRRRRI
jgi:hypothetical protein